jgi:hypothetical protein
MLLVETPVQPNSAHDAGNNSIRTEGACTKKETVTAHYESLSSNLSRLPQLTNSIGIAHAVDNNPDQPGLIRAEKLDSRYFESYLLVPEDTREAKIWEAHASRIARRLLGISATEPCPIHFMLSADHSPNAFIFTGIEPPTIVLSIGLLGLLQSEDELAAIIAHELSHDYLTNKLGEHSVGKFDELFSDLKAVPMLDKAGFRRDALRSAMTRLPDTQMSIFATLKDPHPKKADRIRALEMAEDVLTRPPHGSGPQDIESSPLPEEVSELKRMSPYESFIFNELRSRGFFAAMDNGATGKQIEILTGILKEQLSKPLDPVLWRRRDDLKVALLLLTITPNDPGQEAAITDLVDAIVTRHPAVEWDSWEQYQEDWYYTLEKVYAVSSLDSNEVATLSQASGTDAAASARLATLVQEATRPLGKIQATAQAINRFLAASNQVEAEESARVFNELASQYLDPTKTILCAGAHVLKNSKLPSTHTWCSHAHVDELNRSPVTTHSDTSPQPHEIVPPWIKQLTWACQANSPEINIALRNLFIKHPDLPELNDSDRARVVAGEQFYNCVYEFPQRGWRNLTYSQTGTIIGYSRENTIRPDHTPKDNSGRLTQLVSRAKESVGLHLARRRLVQERAREDRKILKDGHWKSDLRADFAAFLVTYENWLRPQYFRPDYAQSTPFIAAFTEELRALVTSDRAKWVPLIRQFFGALPWDNFAPSHPYISFALDNPRLVLDVNTRGNILLRAYHPSSVRHPEIESKLRSELRSIKNPADIFAFLEEMREWQTSSFMSGCIDKHVTRYLSRNTSPVPSSKRFALIEYLSTLDTHSLTRQHYVDLASDLKGNLPVEEMIPNYRLACSYHIIQRCSDNYTSVDFRGAFASTPLEIAGERILGKNRTLSPEDGILKHRYEEMLIAALKRLVGTGRQVNLSDEHAIKLGQLAESLLFPGELPSNLHSDEYTGRLCYDATVSNPALRQLLVEAYITGKVALFGDENRSNSVHIRATLDEIAKNTTGEVRFSLITKLLDGTNAQRVTSYHGRDLIKDKQLAEAAKSQFAIGLGAELSAAAFEADPVAQADLREFILQPLSPKSLRQAEQSFEEARTRAERNQPLTMFAALFANDTGRTGKKAQKESPSPERLLARKALKQVDPMARSESALCRELRSLHENFWTLPLPLRQVAIQPLLFPVNERADGDFDAIKRSIVDRVIKPDSDTRLFRALVECYLDVSEVNAQRALLSGMLVARQPVAGSQDGLSWIEALKLLELMGPAGRKILQVIHGHPYSSEDVKRAAKTSKSMAAAPFRPEIHEWLETFGPLSDEQVRNNAHVGETLGAGAWGVTVRLQREAIGESAVTLLRPHAREQAEFEFNTLEKALDLLESRHPDIDCAAIRQLLREARRMSLLESDMDVAAEQSSSASKNSDGFIVMVNGHRHVFSTAEWISHGKRYKDTRIASGTHLNDLPQEDSLGPAIGILAKEIYLRMTGLRPPVDHDRHGAQQRIQFGVNETTITEFDFGGMALQPPSRIERELIVKVVCTALRQTLSFRGPGIGFQSFGKTLAKVIQEFCKSPYHSSNAPDSDGANQLSKDDVWRVLGTFQRDVLALWDNVSALGTTARQRRAALADIFRAVMATNDIDPLIASAMQSELGWFQRLALQTWINSSGKYDIKINPASIIFEKNDWE